MKTEKQKKVRISVSLSKDLVDLLDEKTSNRSNLLDWILLQYFIKIGEDISKIKL
jgi:metal-responsive CopG/Arc/MetJ family transcriptional regulator